MHADVKPQNILINREGVVKVTDFGIAQAWTDTMPQTRSQVVWGSPHYFAPEQARGEKPSPASDVYSIGIVLFEMFTGRLPYTGSSQRELALAHLKADLPRATDINPDLPDQLSRVIYKVMSKRPMDRYQHADQLGQILSQIRDIARAERLHRSGVMPAMPVPAPAPPAAAPAAMTPPAPAIPSPPQPFFHTDGTVNVDSTGGYTGPFVPQRQARDSGADIVTIALVVLAFLAVAGLLPLYLLFVLPLIS